MKMSKGWAARGVPVVVALAMGAALAVGGTTSAYAYGRADNPVAQVEVSGNCNNVTVCPSLIGGTGGVWIWAELDATDPTNPTYGTSDFTFQGCGHNVGGPHAATTASASSPTGASGAVGTGGTWQIAASALDAAGAGYKPIDVAVDSNGVLLPVSYYEINLQGFKFAVPVPRGHYSVAGVSYIHGLGPTPGVNFQTQVAP